ncbi:NACHT domain-containing protein [Micromonospora terminaliae]|uniref:NACHT domain-containing protein n=1 Tax=Micromonospora terminaliae TaxID=1914461 RepID=A0AAJ2ZL73_9ACTN|nr:NACHT domain-containing protein [Micromonospora terminaliae]NES31822.1 NACHT domain-containing protein [Micromonospora terminaliae]QGL49907.1 NACHT domain-containing protein [Micromonospora terminaliae]
MRRVVMVGLSVVVVALLGVATNVATGALPARWSPYLWLAWPLVLLLVAVLVLIEVQRGREPRRSGTAGAARARRVLLERVRRYWVTSVLDRSLYEEARIELGIAATADDRRHPWSLQASHRDGFTGSLDDRTSMSALFDQLDEAVVIVGAPGAGKTTTLLELARDLLDRADHDPDAPIPAVFNLSSWATLRRPLDRWLVEQLTERYGIPAGQAAAWVAAGEILPLLDGLDEVGEQHRDECAEAIAAFHQRQPLTPIAVCCRQAEYARLRSALPLYGTVAIQPLDRSQIGRYVDRPGLAGLRAALDADPELWKLADSPLMLSIMALAYADPDDAGPDRGDAGSGRERLFTRYVDTMLRRRPHPRYRPERTAGHLATLARMLRQRDQTVFVLDMIDESWSARRPAAWRTSTALARLLGCAALAAVFVAAGWALGPVTGLVVAGGLLGLAVLMHTVNYADLFELTSTIRDRDERRPESWAAAWTASVAELERLIQVAALVAGVAVGVLIGWFAPGGPSWAAGLGYGGGFFLATVIALIALDSTQVRLRFRPLPPDAGRRELPSPLLRQRLTVMAADLVALGVMVGVLGFVPVALARGTAEALRFAVLLGGGTALALFTVVALTPMVEQTLVRRRLAREGLVPYPLLPFLDHAVQCLFLRQVGDGYIFVHRQLLDHFAERAEAGRPIPRLRATQARRENIRRSARDVPGASTVGGGGGI